MNTTQRENLIRRVNEIDGLTNDERSALIGLLRETKSYGLVWENKVEAVEERLRDELPILTEVPERAIISDDKNAPNHIIIEGDNLEALATLAYTHEGKIDVIYIDPPYNTGIKDFVYNDSFVDKEDSFRHSKWLSFMEKRLRIAQKLLSDDGSIFISVNDIEQANILLLCNNIFGLKHFVTSIPRITKQQRAAQENHMDVSHDYVIVYSFKDDYSHITDRDVDEKRVKHDSIGTYIENDTKAILADKSKGYSQGGDYDFEYNGKVYKPIDSNGVRNRWLWTKPRMEAAAKLGILVETGTTLRMQLYLDKRYDEKTNTMMPKDSKLIFHTSDFMVESHYTNSAGSQELKNVGVDLFRKFNNPKPLALISKLFSFYDKKDIAILDFFAGSGTTLHATMQLNAEDGGHRKCILVTNNENNICEEVTYERNKRVINGYTTPKGKTVEGLKNNNLRYYKTGFVNRERTPQNMRKLVLLATDMLCIKEDIYDEKPVFGEQETYKNVFRFFDNGKKQMLVIYREEAIDQIVDIIRDMEVAEPILVYVFSTSEDPWEGSFEDVGDKVKLCALPMAIYNTYKRVLPKKRDEIINQNEEGGDE